MTTASRPSGANEGCRAPMPADGGCCAAGRCGDKRRGNSASERTGTNPSVTADSRESDVKLPKRRERVKQDQRSSTCRRFTRSPESLHLIRPDLLLLASHERQEEPSEQSVRF